MNLIYLKDCIIFKIITTMIGNICLGFNKIDNESIDVAIDTMRKYQKIEQAIRDYEKLCDSMSEQGLDGVLVLRKLMNFV